MDNHIGTPSYKIGMELRISNVRGDDFGAYRCIAKNPRGETDGEITLTEEIVPTTTPLSTTTTTTVTTTTTTKVIVDIVPKGDRQRSKGKDESYGSPLNEFEKDANWRKNQRRRKERQRNKKKKQQHEKDMDYYQDISSADAIGTALSMLSLVMLSSSLAATAA